MPGFELEMLDGGDPIDLPCGETIIGRGPFLGVSDKRVSRNHGIVENLDGQLRIKPIHLNPCFIQASPQAAPEPLEKDQWHCLKDGSIFSLLPGKYVYRVRTLSGEGTPRNSQGLEEEMEVEKNWKASRLYEETLSYTPQAKNSASLTPTSTLPTYTEEMVTETHKTHQASCSQAVASSSSTVDGPDPPTSRKRILPAWMTSVAPAVLSSSPGKVKRTPVRPVQKPAQPKRTARPKKTQPGPSSGDEEEEEKEEEEHSEVMEKPRRRVKRLKSDTEESQDQTQPPKSNTDVSAEGKEEPDMSSKEDGGEEKEEKKVRRKKREDDTWRTEAGGSTSKAENGSTKPSQNGQQRSKVTKSEISLSTSTAEVQRRTLCPYGASCYRKNPLHFQECSHPGDADYEEEQSSVDQDEDDDRPECPYGTDCYRKNLLHKKEYKHTKPPAKKPRTDDDGDDEEDEDRYEDSFINDESEEEGADEDSDYVPESDSSDKEDVKRLQKEAKAFMRRKK